MLDVRSIASSLAHVDVSALGDDELSTLVIDAELVLNAAHALSAVCVGGVRSARRMGRTMVSLSAASWAANRTGTPARALRARVRAGAGLRLLRSAEPVARAGRLSPAHVTALAACARRHPDLAARDEAVLVDQAEKLDADAFGVTCPPMVRVRRRSRRPRPGGDAGGRAGRRAAPVPHLRGPLPPGWHPLRRVRPPGARLPRGGGRSPDAGGPRRRPVGAARRLPGARRRPGRSRRAGHAPRAVGCVDTGSVSGRRRRFRPPHRRTAAGLLRFGRLPGRSGRRQRGARRRATHPGLAGGHPSGHHCPGRRLRLPRLRSATVLVRHPPLPPVEPGWSDQRGQWGPALSAASHVHPPTPLDRRPRWRPAGGAKTRRQPLSRHPVGYRPALARSASTGRLILIGPTSDPGAPER